VTLFIDAMENGRQISTSTRICFNDADQQPTQENSTTMDMSEFGVWAMLAFWGSALGGIAFAVTWARSRGRNPATREQLLNSLKRRLEKGEISQQDYASRIAEIDAKNGGHAS
jgi:putative membrane protein